MEVKALMDSLTPARKDALEQEEDGGKQFKQVRRFVESPYSVDAPSHEQLVAVRDFLQINGRPRVAAVGTGGRAPASVSPFDEGMTAKLESTTGALANLAGLPVQTRIIVGAADFFVARAKDELVLAYMEDLRRRLEDLPIVDSMLPSFAAMLRRIDAMSPRTLMPVLRAAAVRDFEQLPERATLPSAYPSEFAPLLARHRTTLQGAHLAIVMGREVREGGAPAVVLARLAGLDSTRLGDDRVRSALIVLGVAAAEYVGSEGGIATVADDPLRVPYALAFLAHDVGQAPGFAPRWRWIVRNAANNADSTMLDVVGRADSLRTFVREHQRELVTIISQLHAVQRRIAALRDPSPLAAESEEDPRSMAVSVVAQLVRTALPLIPARGGELAQHTERFRTYLQLAADLEQGITTRDYASIVAALTPLIMPSAGEAADTSMRRVRQGTFRVLALASGLAGAEGTEEVTSVLQAAAEPVGSYRAKRVPDADVSRYSFTINGYVGVGGGTEWSSGRIERGAGAGQFGASLPVGVELARGGVGGGAYTGWDRLLHPLSGIRSWSLFVPLVDLGNVANFRLREDSLADTPEIGFAQVFAPGMFLMAGISASKPFSIGAGVQYAPRLRKALDSDATVSVIRASLVFGVDIPVLRF